MTAQDYISAKIKFSRLKIYLLNYFFLFGLIFFLIGLTIVIHISNTYNSTYADKDKLTESSSGFIIDIEKIVPTSGEGDGTPYFKYKYTFKLDSNNIISFGYSEKRIYNVNDTITVHYDLKNANVSSVDDLRNSKYEKDDTILSWLLPILGFLIIIYSFIWSNKIFRLLENGIITFGTYFKSTKNDDRDGFYHLYIFIDNKGRDRIVKQFSSWRDKKDNEIIVLFDSSDKSNQITLKDLIFFGNKNIKNQIYSAANSR